MDLYFYLLVKSYIFCANLSLINPKKWANVNFFLWGGRGWILGFLLGIIYKL